LQSDDEPKGSRLRWTAIFLVGMAAIAILALALLLK
jgi:hypothetical protein